MKRLTASARERLLSKPMQYGIAYLVYHRSAAWGGGYGVDRMYLLPGGDLMEAFPERYQGFYSSRGVPAKTRAENFARSLCRKYDIIITPEDLD